MAQVQGRTSDSYDDYFADDPQPRIHKLDTEDSTPVYMGRAPCGHVFQFDERHVVDEHVDGSFSVTPQPTPPTGHNSILCRACGWHGYVYRNVWQAI